MLSIVGVGFLNRDNLQSSLWEPVTPAAIGLVSFIGLREWWHSRVQGRLLETVCESEVEIRKLSQFLESVIDNANIWMAVIDQQLNIVLWNKAAESLSGYARGEVLGSSRIWEWLYPEQEKRQRALLRIKQLIEQGSVLEQYETSVRCSDNQLRTIAWNTRSLLGADGRPAGLITLGVDITASQQAERDLRQREERLRVVVENLPMVLFAVDAAGVIRLLEGKGLAALGLRPGELVGRSILDFGEQYPELHEGARRGLAGAGSKLTIEMRGRVFEQWIDPLTDDQGHSAGFIGVALDISERRRLEAQLLQSQKIESIGRLAGGVAHDFNNLLTAIVGYTDLALATLPPDSAARSDLQESQKATQRAISLTRQLLAFARKQIIAPRVLNLNELILDMDSLLRRLIGEDVTLVMLPVPNLGPIRVDPHQMEQVLVNLVVNARDAMPHGGQLVVETCNIWVDERTPRANGELAAGAYVLLTISDTGIGMPAEVRAHVFEPFFTTKTASQGSGLGLATCYGIVKQHGGHIAIDSQPDYGTTVSVYLPRVEAPPDLLPRAVELHNLPSGHESVLLVEDELGVRMLAGRVLREAGYTVLEAAHGAEALQVVQGHAPKPLQLLVVDMVMPHMGGQAVAERIAAIYPAVKVLFMSGYTDSAIVHPGMGLPDQGFLQKPFTPATLARKVRTILDGRG